MDIWKLQKWEKYYKYHSHRSGLRIRYDSAVDSEVKRAIDEFVLWLRSRYNFPMRVQIYVKAHRRIKTQSGDFACGTFFGPYDRDLEPYIKIATGDYYELLEFRGKDNALAGMLWCIAHELTHYYQWLNDVRLTSIGEERQATNYANKVMDLYSSVKDHP